MSTATLKKRMRPAKTSEAREQQIAALAVDAIEQRILNGTATAQELILYAKQVTVKAQLDKEEQRARINLMKAKQKAIESGELQEEFYSEVIKAVRSYQGTQSDDAGTNPVVQ